MFFKIREGRVGVNTWSSFANNGDPPLFIRQISYVIHRQQRGHLGGDIYKNTTIIYFTSGFVSLLQFHGLHLAQFRNITDNNETGIPQTQEKERIESLRDKEGNDERRLSGFC